MIIFLTVEDVVLYILQICPTSHSSSLASWYPRLPQEFLSLTISTHSLDNITIPEIKVTNLGFVQSGIMYPTRSSSHCPCPHRSVKSTPLLTSNSFTVTLLKTCPKTPCLPASYWVLTVKRKNWEPLVLGPAFIMGQDSRSGVLEDIFLLKQRFLNFTFTACSLVLQYLC